MNVQQHERISRIKQFSRYLYVCLTWMRYLMWVTWPVSVVLVLVTKGQLSFGAASITGEDLLNRIFDMYIGPFFSDTESDFSLS